MTTTYLTPEGFQKLQDELDYLRTVRRQEVADRLHEALEDGDQGIDADAECDAARNEQAFVEGRILHEPRGTRGFGYDPLFLADGEELSMAELPPERKNRISHRGRASVRMRDFLAAYLQERGSVG